MSTLLILLIIVVVVAFWAVGIYNGLVRARNAFRNAFAQIDVQLQRRFDLIPNLVETAKGYMQHERDTLEAVIAARGAAMAGLSADHRTVVELTYFQDLSYREIAEIMECPVDTVKTRMFYARRQLKRCLDGELPDWI